jgi:hypothetical protein
LGILLLAALLAAAPAAARSRSAVPRGFVGMVVTAPVFPPGSPAVDLGRQLDRMVASGVENLRVVFNWAAAQPYRSWSQVPSGQRSQYIDVGGVPTDFSQTDAIMAAAAARQLSVLPVVLYAPGWDEAAHPAGTYGIPARTGPYAAYLRALVERYGLRGSFWSTRRQAAPIRAWQIWNEPNITVFWPRQPFERSYVALLRAAHRAVKGADPQAKVVLAGLPNYSWRDLARIYSVPGARRLFDIVAVHPYTRSPTGVIAILRRVRRAMDAAGDRRKPILADEISWPSSLRETRHTEGFDFATTERGQARNIATLLPLLARERTRLDLLGFDYYTWASSDARGGLAFDFAGLLTIHSGRLVAKPAFYAFRRAALALERCRVKGPTATACARAG